MNGKRIVRFAVSFLILIGVFVKDAMEFPKDHPGWNKAFIIIMFIGVILIFLNAIYMNIAGEEVSVLEYVIDWIIDNWSGTVFGAIIILIVVIVTIGLIIKTPKPPKDKREEK